MNNSKTILDIKFYVFLFVKKLINNKIKPTLSIELIKNELRKALIYKLVQENMN
ncbi:hypothetical protein MW871_04065 [Flavobacterium sp. I-SCBP12n]|uniref:Uncharacterized protein n=1 Tax=Flavobacterium pygoscelis TaxID=2893176 RepID=A0A9X1XT43_9FLAO|nr:hypothetical protein [Flavobacterium pygoscelis]MCK8141061.1 hypothetical protein [Flavobacterium pygoscelis]